MVETLTASVANTDGCITKEEFKEVKKEMFREMHKHHMPKPADAE